ncbi:MAG: Bcr/CflA family drug resistance efflux transporter [Rhodobacterales bacterium 65-51]|jgi:DHA1 family bicyclomycin/chloramphenicol resistance-like MFS transporter|uniref:Bcr/CflA family efflux transporter n=2 Tax=Bacteria TaxID=2 RepID=A0ABQ3F8Y5_9RHOB|nr:multidrug effflux MFS transporter [Gemmobacter nanjingensis]OJY27515.1 MAG: Bcr/CflA family drug resistance efflux transporter [Rhodobacterales bacterium 65-51]GHC14508.1 Bcr/CflA family drug resistance efflux transporter [Gemmobacter nanjingensis]
MQLPPSRFLDPTTPPKIVTLTLLAGVSALTMNIFLPSLPGMAEWFGTSYGLMQLSVALYLALSAVLQIAIGPISDRYGRRRVVLGALLLFLLATVGTLLAPNATAFLIFRMAQAVVAAGMVLSRAIVRDMVSDAEAASMIGYVTMGMSLVPMIGPVIGGVLDEYFGWHANFGLLLAAGIAVTVLCWRDLGETSTPSGMSFTEQARQYPLLLRSQRFWGYCLSAAFASGCFFAYLGGAPFVGTEVFGLSASRVGMLFALTALGYAGGNFFAGRYSVRIGMNRMVLLGTVVTTLSSAVLALLSLLDLTTAFLFFGLTLFMGLGNGICLPNANAGILSVRPELAGTASGLGGAFIIGGGAGLAALAGILLQPGSSELPLVLLILASSVASVLSILWVMQRARALGLSG